MYRILVAECMQEASSFNPVETRYEDFRIRRGQDLFALHRGVESYVSGALQVFEARPDVEAVPLLGADACSSGLLRQEGFEQLTHNVWRWTNPWQRHRWAATALLDIEPRLRRVNGYHHLPMLGQRSKPNPASISSR